MVMVEYSELIDATTIYESYNYTDCITSLLQYLYI